MGEMVKPKTSEEVIGEYESLSAEAYEMLSLAKRVQSFRSWPYEGQVCKSKSSIFERENEQINIFIINIAAEEMAKAGWYQTGPLCCRHVISLKELDGWDGQEDPVAEVKSRESALTTCKWSPGIKALAIPDDEVRVGTRYRFIKLQKICKLFHFHEFLVNNFLVH